jgi:hypothetical protein
MGDWVLVGRVTCFEQRISLEVSSAMLLMHGVRAKLFLNVMGMAFFEMFYQ